MFVAILVIAVVVPRPPMTLTTATSIKLPIALTIMKITTMTAMLAEDTWDYQWNDFNRQDNH